jgi:triosephosphate isomerase
VKAKAEAVIASGMNVIVCVGETEAQRDAGKAESVVAKQLKASLPDGEGVAEKVTVAYEPVWAIGTGRTPTVDDIGAMHRSIRKVLQGIYGEEEGSGVRILYGGSVKPDNAAELLAADEVGGALVGGASLTAESFLGIIVAAAEAGEG